MYVVHVPTGHQCTFETDQCNWTNFDSGSYTWIRYRGATPSQNTGPTYDHTTLTAQGQIYVESISSRQGKPHGDSNLGIFCFFLMLSGKPF